MSRGTDRPRPHRKSLYIIFARRRTAHSIARSNLNITSALFSSCVPHIERESTSPHPRQNGADTRVRQVPQLGGPFHDQINGTAIEALVFCWGFFRLMCREDAGQIKINASGRSDGELIGAARQIDRGIAVSSECRQASDVVRAISRQSLQRDAARIPGAGVNRDAILSAAQRERSGRRRYVRKRLQLLPVELGKGRAREQ